MADDDDYPRGREADFISLNLRTGAGWLARAKPVEVEGRGVWAVPCAALDLAPGEQHAHIYCPRCLTELTPRRLPQVYADVVHAVLSHVCGYRPPRGGKEGCDLN